MQEWALATKGTPTSQTGNVGGTTLPQPPKAWLPPCLVCALSNMASTCKGPPQPQAMGVANTNHQGCAPALHAKLAAMGVPHTLGPWVVQGPVAPKQLPSIASQATLAGQQLGQCGWAHRAYPNTPPWVSLTPMPPTCCHKCGHDKHKTPKWGSPHTHHPSLGQRAKPVRRLNHAATTNLALQLCG